MSRLRYLIVYAQTASQFGPILDAMEWGWAGLSPVLCTPRLLVFASASADILALPDEVGVIVGKLFRISDSRVQVSELTRRELDFVAETNGRSLLASFWGAYVSVVRTADGVCTARDPSGGIACYHARNGGVVAFASDAELLFDFGVAQPAIDWEPVGFTLYHHQLSSSTTALRDVSQVLPGCAAIVRERGVETQEFWTPWSHIEPDEDRALLPERLHDVVRSVHDAWAGCFMRPLVGLSGGLDSSIVTSCLAAALAQVACVTVGTNEPIGDERSYAREVSASISAQLAEMQYDMGLIDLDRSVAEHIAVPCGKTHEQAFNAAIHAAAELFGADAWFVGAGGDNVFYMTHSARPLVDRYRAEGLSPGVIATLSDISAITGASVQHVLREARRVARLPTDAIDWRSAPKFLNREFVESQRGREADHPWLRPARSIPIGKIGHVMLLLRALHHVEHRDKTLDAPMISSLLSQPIVELCLRTPTWLSCQGGVDRAVARSAFAQMLPAKIIKRAGKGSPDSFVSQIVAKMRAQIAERLLDGELASHGLLDRDAVERALAPNAMHAPGECPRLMALIDTEAWARKWSGAADVSAHSNGRARH